MRHGFIVSTVAMAVAVAMVVSTSVPAHAHEEGGGGAPSEPAECTGGSGSGLAGTSPLVPPGPFTQTIGISPPDDLNPAPISVDVRIAPGPGENFQSIRLTQVVAIPKAKVLRDGSLDPGHARNKWGFTVEQFCPVNNTMAVCTYTYHEMPDGRVWELITVDGQPFEHSFLMSCVGADAWRAGPEDRGARLLAAARANVAADAHLAVLAPALRRAFIGDGPEAAGLDPALLSAMQQLTAPSPASIAALVPGFSNALTAAGWIGFLGLGAYVALLSTAIPCYGQTLPVWAFSVLTAAAITVAAVSTGGQASISFGAAVVGYLGALGTLALQLVQCFAVLDASGGVALPTVVLFLAASVLGILGVVMYANTGSVVERLRGRYIWAGITIPLGFELLNDLG